MFVPIDVKPGGFTITSPPSRAKDSENSPGYLELAIQESPDSKPARWLWLPKPEIVGQAIGVRVGGSFVWPPTNIDTASIKKVIFVGGGMGINPLMSILSHLGDMGSSSPLVHFLYSTKITDEETSPKDILFLERIASLFKAGRVNGNLSLFLTGLQTSFPEHTARIKKALDGDPNAAVAESRSRVVIKTGRINHPSIVDALGSPGERASVVVYICGPPKMTDELTEFLTSSGALGLSLDQIRFEKWW